MNEVKKYVKKPIKVEAVQVSWKNWNVLCEFMNRVITPVNPGRETDKFSDTCGETGPYIELTIPTLEGNHIARHGDWIIKGINGEFYPCNSDIFKKTYCLHVSDEKSGVDEIAEERNRQITEEGWTPEHDDQHKNEELTLAGACYALPDKLLRFALSTQVNKKLWPFDGKWYKRTPDNRIKELRKAGALIAAEIDRLKRLKKN